MAKDAIFTDKEAEFLKELIRQDYFKARKFTVRVLDQADSAYNWRFCKTPFRRCGQHFVKSVEPLVVGRDSALVLAKSNHKHLYQSAFIIRLEYIVRLDAVADNDAISLIGECIAENLETVICHTE